LRKTIDFTMLNCIDLISGVKSTDVPLLKVTRGKRMLIRNLLISCFFISVVSCQSKPLEISTDGLIVSEENHEIKPVIEAQPIITVTLGKYTKPEEKIKLETAIAKANEVLNSDCFKKEFLASTITRKFRDEKRDPKDPPNDHVLNEILKPFPIPAHLEMYYRGWSKVVGYGYGNSMTVHLNRKFYNHFSQCEMGSNLSHEIAGHKHGYADEAGAKTAVT